MVHLITGGASRNGLGDPRGVRFPASVSPGELDTERSLSLLARGVEVSDWGEFIGLWTRVESATLGSLEGLIPGPLRIRLRLIGRPPEWPDRGPRRPGEEDRSTGMCGGVQRRRLARERPSPKEIMAISG